MKNRRSVLLTAFTLLIVISGCATAPPTPQLHVIAAYEGSYPPGVRHSHGYHPDGAIDVEVHTKGHPVVLALSSHEPVVWNIKPDNGVIIKEIILSGYHPSKVVG